ncbi:MAG: metal ABC transporter substrate-binding protein, partial [Acidimicrobiaceae bacterium]
MRNRPLKKLATVFALITLASCSNSTETVTQPTAETTTNSVVADLPVIAVTYSIIGDLVSQLAGDNAAVSVIIPDGQDPHDFQPSAKDIETINNADLVVSNGLEFEEGLEEVLENIADSGGKIFMVGEHITVRKIENDGDDHGKDQNDDDHDHKHTGGDPHVWLSPATMLEMLPALTSALSEAVGADLSTQATALTTQLQDLEGQVESIIKGLDECNLVSGHDELGYFADRYGCKVIGAIIPSFTTTSEATAGELAELKR